MTDTHKLMARTVVLTEVSRFSLAEGETLDQRVAQEIVKAGEAGRLSKMATRVGLPSLAVSEIGEGEGIGGAPEVAASIALYAPDGSPVAQRSFRVQPVEGGSALFTNDDESGAETAVGVFADEGVAEQIGILWRNGHLQLAS